MKRILKLGRQSRGMARCDRAIRALMALSRGMAPRHLAIWGSIALIPALCAVTLFAQDDGRTIKPVNAARKIALVMGNSAYRNRPLANPANDARDVGGRLRELGFDADIVLDGGKRQMAEGIDRFLRKLGAGDVALFYYSGHGAQIDGENYLIPVDFEGQDETDVRYDTQAAGKIQERMERSGAQLNIIVLDACRDNPFRASSRDAAGGLAAMNAGRGTFVAFATAPGRTASDNSRGRNGLFTQYFLEALRQPGLGLDDVFNAVREHVDESSGGKQLPWTQSAVVGRFTFVAGAPTSSLAASAVDRRLDGTWTANAEYDTRLGGAGPNGPRVHVRISDSLQITPSGDGFAAVWHQISEFKGLDDAKDGFTRRIDATFSLRLDGSRVAGVVKSGLRKDQPSGYREAVSGAVFEGTLDGPNRLKAELFWEGPRKTLFAHPISGVLERQP